MSDRDFEIGGRKFKLNKIDAFKQFHIMRRIAPILGELIPVAQKLAKSPEENQMESFTPIMNGIAKLSDADANLVLLGLCSAVEVQQVAGNWSRVATGELLVMQDLPLPTLLQIAGRSFMYNMSDFFALAPQVSPGQK